jgi:hypothetical protein
MWLIVLSSVYNIIQIFSNYEQEKIILCFYLCGGIVVFLYVSKMGTVDFLYALRWWFGGVFLACENDIGIAQREEERIQKHCCCDSVKLALLRRALPVGFMVILS